MLGITGRDYWYFLELASRVADDSVIETPLRSLLLRRIPGVFRISHRIRVPFMGSFAAQGDVGPHKGCSKLAWECSGSLSFHL